MSTNVLRNLENTAFEGCDFVVSLPENHRVKILQLTDMQVIDAFQRRTPERLRPDEIAAWLPENFDKNCGDHIRSLVAQTRPDLIIITGDIVYGSFDDAGTTLQWMCALMDSFEIPWAPVFGNHDNESTMGVAWQCEQFEKSRYCLFKRGNVSGNSNYTVGIAVGNELVRVIHMVDSNSCRSGKDPSLVNDRRICPDQLELIARKTETIRKAQGRAVPAFMAFHLPTPEFVQAEIAKGYKKDEDDYYVLGVDVPAKDRDFGFSLEHCVTVDAGEGFVDFLHAQNVDGVFVGHVHNNCISISQWDIVWTFGLKTGLYDYHVPYQTGGTQIILEGVDFTVNHVPSLVRCGALPGKAPMFDHFLEYGDQ